MCAECFVFITLSRWHVAHVSLIVAFLSCALSDLKLCTLWHVVQPTFRLACALLSHIRCSPRLWHVVQTALASLAVIVLNVRIFVLSPPPSTCAWPGP